MTATLVPQVATKQAVEQCEILLTHLQRCEGKIDARFMRVHALALLGLIGDIGGSPEVEPLPACLVQGAYLCR